jgi:long-chain fatty acid transport protein
MRSASVRIIATAALVVLVPLAASATNGYFSHGIGLKAKGMGGVSIALPQDALAAGTNPAGTVFVGDRIDVGVDLFRPDRESEIIGNENPPLNMVYDANEEQNFFIPELGYCTMLGDNLALGLSVYGNGGMNTSYSTPIGLFGNTKAGVDLAQMFVVPSLAMKLGEDQALGLGVNVVWQRFKAEGLQNFAGTDPQFSSAPDKVTNNGYDSSTGVGLRIGWLGHFGDTFAVGASYQSRTYMSEFDEYSGLFAEEGDFDIPSSYGVGVAFMPRDGLVLAADVTRIMFSEVKSVANPLLPNLAQSPLGTEDGAGFGWEDVTVFKLGVAYDVTPTLTVRGGYNYGGQPIPTSETLFNMLAPAVVEHHVTVGCTYAVSESVEVTLAYMHALKNTVEGDNSIIPGGFEVGGMGGGEADLTMSQDSFGLGVGVLF